MINKAMLLGRVGKKEYKETKNNDWVCKISLATNKKYTSKDGVKHDETTWHNVNFFGRLAEVANNFAHVGDLIFVEGTIANKQVEDNGVKKIFSSIIGSEIKLLPNAKKEENEPEVDKTNTDVLHDDAIPF